MHNFQQHNLNYQRIQYRTRIVLGIKTNMPTIERQTAAHRIPNLLRIDRRPSIACRSHLAQHNRKNLIDKTHCSKKHKNTFNWVENGFKQTKFLKNISDRASKVSLSQSLKIWKSTINLLYNHIYCLTSMSSHQHTRQIQYSLLQKASDTCLLYYVVMQK